MIEPNTNPLRVRISEDTPTHILESVDRLIPYSLNFAQVQRETIILTLHVRATTSPHRINLVKLILAEYTHPLEA